MLMSDQVLMQPMHKKMQDGERTTMRCRAVYPSPRQATEEEGGGGDGRNCFE
jgi:hypothetical protein